MVCSPCQTSLPVTEIEERNTMSSVSINTKLTEPSLHSVGRNFREIFPLDERYSMYPSSSHLKHRKSSISLLQFTWAASFGVVGVETTSFTIALADSANCRGVNTNVVMFKEVMSNFVNSSPGLAKRNNLGPDFW